MLPGRDIEASQSLAKEIGKITKYQAAYEQEKETHWTAMRSTRLHFPAP